jgi:mycoredoxin
MYSTGWCGHCLRLKRQLSEAGIAFVEVDVDEPQNRHIGERIIAKTGGYRVVPTLEIDGELYVNPPIAEVIRAVRQAV